MKKGCKTEIYINTPSKTKYRANSHCYSLSPHPALPFLPAFPLPNMLLLLLGASVGAGPGEQGLCAWLCLQRSEQDRKGVNEADCVKGGWWTRCSQRFLLLWSSMILRCSKSLVSHKASFLIHPRGPFLAYQKRLRRRWPLFMTPGPGPAVF